MVLYIISLFLYTQSYCNLTQSQIQENPTSTEQVFKSTDGGMTWSDVSDGLPKDIFVNDLVTIENEIIISNYDNIYRKNTLEPNSKWEKDTNLTANSNRIFQEKSGIYILCMGKGFYFKDRNSDTWKPVFKGLKNELERCMLETPSGAILIGTDNGIFKSEDGGITWHQVSKEFLVSNILNVDDVLIASSSSNILQSKDAGETWKSVMSIESSIRETSILNDRIVAIVNQKTSSAKTNEDKDVYTSMLYASADHGSTWQRMDKNLTDIQFIYRHLSTNMSSQSIIDIKQAGKYIFCSMNTGIFRSENGGHSWELVFPVSGENIYGLAVSGAEIYALKLPNGC